MRCTVLVSILVQKKKKYNTVGVKTSVSSKSSFNIFVQGIKSKLTVSILGGGGTWLEGHGKAKVALCLRLIRVSTFASRYEFRVVNLHNRVIMSTQQRNTK